MRILEARAQLARVQGTIYPQKQEMTGDLFTIGDEQTQVTIDRYYSVASLGFDVDWEMDFWGRFRRGIEAALRRTTPGQLTTVGLFTETPQAPPPNPQLPPQMGNLLWAELVQQG